MGDREGKSPQSPRKVRRMRAGSVKMGDGEEMSYRTPRRNLGNRVRSFERR